MIFYADCKHFRGDVPCTPHKQTGVHCTDCSHYVPRSGKILLIKLGAIGDVIRTTPLLHKLRAEFPQAAIWWLTQYPEVVPSSSGTSGQRPESADLVLKFSPASLLRIQATEFDLVINLDKDAEACALTALINHPKTLGFTLRDGKPAAVNALADHKFLTGLFDDVNKANTKSYLEEIFEICGWTFAGEEYIMDVSPKHTWDIPSGGKPIIGLNTGCGGRWTSRLWSDERWIRLIRFLQDNGCYPLLLGGEQEHDKNSFFARETGALYLGHFDFEQFIALMNHCDSIVSAVTMAMHIAIGIKKPLILFVNIFNPNEFELYGRGEIVQPERECTCFFQATCSNKEYQCMEHLSVESVGNAVVRSLSPAVRA
jgi:ADP-heptose:LPS heptosyltransferase